MRINSRYGPFFIDQKIEQHIQAIRRWSFVARPQRNAGAGAGSGGGADHEPMGEPINDLTDDDIPF